MRERSAAGGRDSLRDEMYDEMYDGRRNGNEGRP